MLQKITWLKIFQKEPTQWISKCIPYLDHKFLLYQRWSILANVPITYPLKTPENLQFPGVFRGYKMGALARNRLISKSWVVGNSKLYQTVSSVDFYKNYDQWFPTKYWSNNAEIIKNIIRNIKMLKENFFLGEGFFWKGCNQLKHARTLNLLLFFINEYWKWTHRPVLITSINLS